MVTLPLVQEIKQHMKKNKMTQADFCREIKSPEATFNRWLRGKHEISPAWEQIIRSFLATPKTKK